MTEKITAEAEEKTPKAVDVAPPSSAGTGKAIQKEDDEEDEEDLTGSEMSRSFSPDSGAPRHMYTRSSADRPHYSYPPPPPPTTLHAPHPSHHVHHEVAGGMHSSAAHGTHSRRVMARRGHDEYSD